MEGEVNRVSDPDIFLVPPPELSIPEPLFETSGEAEISIWFLTFTDKVTLAGYSIIFLGIITLLLTITYIVKSRPEANKKRKTKNKTKHQPKLKRPDKI